MKIKRLAVVAICATLSLQAQKKQRAREFGIPFEGRTGIHNAITDVPGVLAGYKTLISGKDKNAVRTGVTVILPTGKDDDRGYPAGYFSLNGDGEMTGTTVIDEYGLGYGPIGITNTNSVGVVRDAIGEWSAKKFSKGGLIDFSFGLPVAAETWDGMLNDINGFHVKREHVLEALDNAASGPLAEGNVGGGTGMGLFHFKGGSGTSSRMFKVDSGEYTVGVFVQANFGGRKDLMISGVPVGKEITEAMPVLHQKEKDGSIIVIIATDAPLLPSQLKQLAKRASIGVARTGGFAYNSSGDIFLAFSTASPQKNNAGTLETWTVFPKERLDPLYRSAALATEEAIINALMAADTMEGFNGNILYEIPKDKLKHVMQKYGRMPAN